MASSSMVDPPSRRVPLYVVWECVLLVYSVSAQHVLNHQWVASGNFVWICFAACMVLDEQMLVMCSLGSQ